MICETMHELDEWYFVMKISYLKCYDEAWLNILISWCITLIDFDTTWLYILLSKLEYEIWFMKNYDIRNIMNWQPDYVKDLANGVIYVGNWFVLRVYIVRETSSFERLCCQMICSSPQEDIRYYDPTIEKIWL